MIRTWLKVYFWFVCLLIVASLLFDLGDGEPLVFLDYLDWVFTLITLSGVYAYCYKTLFFTAEFWRNYIRVLIVWDLYYVLSSIAEDASIFTEESGLVVLVLVILFYFTLLVPAYIALYLLPKEFDKKDPFEMQA